MKMVIAYIRHEAFEPIRADLLEAGFPSITITEVKGSGRQKAITEHYRGSELAVHLRPKLKLECVVESKDVGVIKETILRHARTGSVGDGKLFVLPVEDAVRIRTGEEGEMSSRPTTRGAQPATGGAEPRGHPGEPCARRRYRWAEARPDGASSVT